MLVIKDYSCMDAFGESQSVNANKFSSNDKNFKIYSCHEDP